MFYKTWLFANICLPFDDELWFSLHIINWVAFVSLLNKVYNTSVCF